jgi:hypothetical protein
MAFGGGQGRLAAQDAEDGDGERAECLAEQLPVAVGGDPV